MINERILKPIISPIFVRHNVATHKNLPIVNAPSYKQKDFIIQA